MLPVRRPSLLLLALLLAGTTACAEGPVGRRATPDRGAESDRRAAVPASPEPTAQAALTPDAAAAAATAVNLVAADLPGFSSSRPAPAGEARLTAIEAVLARCVGAATSGAAPGARSPAFRRQAGVPNRLVTSAVRFRADEGQVAADLAAYRSRAAPACVASYVARTLDLVSGGPGISFARPEVVRLDVSGPAGEEAYGFRATTTGAAGRTRTPFVVDVVSLARARTEAGLLVIGAGEDVPAAERDRLVGVLSERLREHAV